MAVTRVAGLDIPRAHESLRRIHWPEGSAVAVKNAGKINGAAKSGKVASPIRPWN